MWRKRLLAHGIVVSVLLTLAAAPVDAGDEDCYAIPADEWAPAGTAGCTLDGPTDGVASTWSGGVAAAQWCLYPWTSCTPVTVQSHQTGIVITVTPEQFCMCFWMTDRRLIDLSHDQVLALGLLPEAGRFQVTVTPIRSSITLPDTAAKRYNTMTANEAGHIRIGDGPASVLIPPGRGRSHTRGMRP